MFNSRYLTILTIFLLLVYSVNSDQLMSADLKNHFTNLGLQLWNNINGLVIKIQEYGNDFNDLLLQDYLLNSNIQGIWINNWAISIQSSKNYHFDCSIYANYTPNCVVQMRNNFTFWGSIRSFIYNTQNQPYWTWGFNNQFIDFDDFNHQNAFYDQVFQVYYTTYYSYHFDLINGGDKMVENGLREGNFTVEDFINHAVAAQNIAYGLYYASPGINQDSAPQWKSSISDYMYNVWNGLFTFQCTVFRDPGLVTIQNILSEQANTLYIKQLFKIDDTTSVHDIIDQYNYFRIRISKASLMEGDGIDGITNTFAAAIWWVDFVMAITSYGVYDVHYYSSGQYQRAFGLSPNYEPTAIYMGMIFVSLIRNGNANTLIPTVVAGSSLKIKVWGLQTRSQKNILILNKDTNTSLDGYVKVYMVSTKSQKLKCTKFKAPTMQSKIQDITLGGYTFIGGDNTPQGTYTRQQFSYDDFESYYKVNIKYAQSAYCEVSSVGLSIPPGRQCYEYGLRWISILIILVLALI